MTIIYIYIRVCVCTVSTGVLKSGNDGVGFNGLTCSKAPTPCLICATCMSINRHPYKTPGWNNCAPLHFAVIYHTTRHWYQHPGHHHTRGTTIPHSQEYFYLFLSLELEPCYQPEYMPVYLVFCS